MTLALTPEDSLFARVGEDRLRRVLWAFYARVTRDPDLGPVFTRRIGPFPQAGWPLHIARLEGFWRAVTGGPGAYRGQPGPAHSGLGIGPAHFGRWLALWETTLGEELPAAEAAALLRLARRMHPNLERHALAAPPEAPHVQ
ncbi:group III truncated hemoglobin [Deinococcus sp. MIMF12]|uniref:Group III truncated hemoglobin n=1 Tax=Deinococcus rhizophilus TaxID=3049544 RepID=A0ABT7JIH1_9DEIO|nr:group III truncated hemoglobin [Deinococcus rhizophilus]MDL2344860.1 group III truncated hemoglobin [Deinococcus rhizophilus]